MNTIFDIIFEKYIDESLDESHYESLLLNIFQEKVIIGEKDMMKSSMKYCDDIDKIWEEYDKNIRQGMSKDEATKIRNKKQKKLKMEHNSNLIKFNRGHLIKTVGKDAILGATIGAAGGSAIGALSEHHKLKKDGIVQYLKDNKKRYNILKKCIENKINISDSDKKFMKDYEDTKMSYKNSIHDRTRKYTLRGAGVGAALSAANGHFGGQERDTIRRLKGENKEMMKKGE